MTDREKAIVMAYTGVCMLQGDKLSVFYDYVEEIMGSRIDTLGIAILAENIKRRSRPHFIKLCKDETPSPLQKPLTVEELLEIAHKTEECDRTVWMEDATGWADGIVFHVCSVFYDSDEEAFIHYMLGDDNSFETEPSHYGKTWRCWATKPTDEERQAAAWE